MSLIEVQKLAIQRNEKLGNPKLGGQLFLGKHYKESDILFLGLNPGLWNFKHRKECKAQCNEKHDFIFENFGSLPFWTNLLHENVLLEGNETGDFPFWENARKFFGFIPRTKDKMHEAIFSFLVPWRSEKWADVRNDENFLKPSKEILNNIQKDCRPNFIFISGSGEETRKDIQNFFGDVLEKYKLDLGIGNNLYKLFILSYGEKYIIQLPHFSRANSPDLLEKLAKFLEVKLKELNFFKI